MSTESRARLYECLGGPLCGSKVADGLDTGKMVWDDGDGRLHFYRLMKVVKDDNSASATFFHYFGNDVKRAQKAIPTLRPPENLFRKRKKK